MSKHLSPNGKPSKLTHEQWHLVRTPEFKAWFGDWEKAYETGNYDGVSKVIDEETKEPLVVYHGSNNMDEIEVFKSKKGFDYNFFSSDKYEPYRYVTDFERMFPNDRYNKSLRDSYYAKKIKKFFLNAKNPFDYNKITQKEKQKVLVFLQDNEQILIRRIVEFAENSGLSFSSYLREYDIEEEISNIDLLIFFLEKNSDDWWILETDVFQKYIKDNGYDAFVTKESGAYNLAIYNSKNIKLADGTNTTFDANNPDVRYAKGGKVDIVNIVDVKFDEKICQEWRFVRISEKKYDKIELYRKATWDDNKFYGDLLYRKVPKYIETFKSKMVNDRNQIFAFSGSNQAIANAVFEGEKPFGSLIEVYEKKDKDKSDKFFEDTISKCKELNIEYYLSKEEKWSNVNTRRYLQICHKGTFGELFDLEAFKNDYVSSKTLDKYTMIHIVDSIENRKLSYYLKDFRWDDTTPIIITGLILGIPLYFTMSIINSGHTYNLNKKYEY
jgi:hypothetical protein